MTLGPLHLHTYTNVKNAHAHGHAHARDAGAGRLVELKARAARVSGYAAAVHTENERTAHTAARGDV